MNVSDTTMAKNLNHKNEAAVASYLTGKPTLSWTLILLSFCAVFAIWGVQFENRILFNTGVSSTTSTSTIINKHTENLFQDIQDDLEAGKNELYGDRLTFGNGNPGRSQNNKQNYVLCCQLH